MTPFRYPRDIFRPFRPLRLNSFACKYNEMCSPRQACKHFACGLSSWSALTSKHSDIDITTTITVRRRIGQHEIAGFCCLFFAVFESVSHHAKLPRRARDFAGWCPGLQSRAWRCPFFENFHGPMANEGTINDVKRDPIFGHAPFLVPRALKKAPFCKGRTLLHKLSERELG
jgi:hypothetical protein